MKEVDKYPDKIGKPCYGLNREGEKTVLGFYQGSSYSPGDNEYIYTVAVFGVTSNHHATAVHAVEFIEEIPEELKPLIPYKKLFLHFGKKAEVMDPGNSLGLERRLFITFQNGSCVTFYDHRYPNKYTEEGVPHPDSFFELIHWNHYELIEEEPEPEKKEYTEEEIKIMVDCFYNTLKSFPDILQSFVDGVVSGITQAVKEIEERRRE